MIQAKRINNQPISDELNKCFLVAKTQYLRSNDNNNLNISKKDLQGKNHGKF